MTEHNLQQTCNKLATDTISRQAAIDEWKNDFKGYVNMLDIPKDDYNGIMAYIDELPSVQPEPGTSDLISRQAAYNALVKHEESDGQHNYSMFRSVVSECEEIILDLPSAQPKQQWIPCSERLPDKEGQYLVTDEAGGVEEVAWKEKQR